MRHASNLAILSSLFCSLSYAAMTDGYEPPASYYSGVSGTGATLKAQLQAAMSAGHIQRTYGNFRDMSRYIDTDPDNPSNILLVYNRASVSGGWDSGSTWNREHVWPQSRQPWSASNGSTGSVGDPHALRPCNPSINSSRGNKPFGGGANTTGSHRSLGSFYFPGDDDKGDIARSLFYSDTRYDGIELVNGMPSGNQMGDLESLIAWHYLDIPDAFERRRNHAIYSASLNPLRTNNRNAYVDHPEFVWSVYVDQMNDSTIFLGDLEPADGASAIEIDLGALLVGQAVTPVSVDLNKNGDDGTYYRVIPSEGITTSLDGPYQAFPIGSHGASVPLELYFDASITDNSGLCVCSVVIDNLDVTNQGGAGNGANDGDDVITVTATVYEQGNGSFDDDADINTLELDLGTADAGAGPVSQQISFFNIPADAFTAPIDIELVSGVGDTSVITTDFAPVSGLGVLTDAPVTVTLDDQSVGVYNATYTFRVYNARALFSDQTPVEDLVLNVTGRVEPGCPADLTGDGVLDFFDVSAFLSAYSSGDSDADFNNDGSLNFFDVSAFLSAYGAGCP